MNHPAELALHQYMDSAVKGDSTMSETTINQVAAHCHLWLRTGGQRQWLPLRTRGRSSAGE